DALRGRALGGRGRRRRLCGRRRSRRLPIPVKRVAVMGGSASGKTTTAKRLAEILGVPHVELDALNHEPGWREAPVDVFRARVLAACSGDGWVVDGNYRS